MADVSAIETVADLIEDPAEETFLLFSQDHPPNDLGMIDPQSSEVEIVVNGHEYSISQSSGLLRSNRATGTTGAVVWKITPRIAQWLSSSRSLLWEIGIVKASHSIIELGCGISGVIAMSLSPLVNSYTLTDQPYVMKLLKENIERNMKPIQQRKRPTKGVAVSPPSSFDNIYTLPLDWEQDSVQNLKTNSPSVSGIDVIIICDCIYNNFLIEPLVQTCIDVCRLDTARHTTVVVAQQLRSDDVFEEWLTRFNKDFNVWRPRDEHLPSELQSSSGYVVHVGRLRHR